MNTFTRLFMACFLFCTLLISACSGEQEKKETSTIEQGTDRVANEAVQAIKTPIDQAKSAAEQQTNHNSQITEQEKKP